MRPSFDTIGRRRTSVPLFILCVALLAGCARSEVVTELPPEQQNLRTIVMSYQQALADLSRSPKDLDELRPYVAEFGDADTILTSPNDGKPYVIVWNFDAMKLRRGQMPIVAYEQEGRDGQHKAVDYQLAVRSLSTQQIAALAKPQ